ncbi:MAG: LptF/LptG family permease [Bacteroidota bacterium]
MKQLDRLMIKAFIGPFIVTFGIATFTLLMQVLWNYIPNIAGRGIGFFIILELLAYKCVGLVPMALPLAILISSVMVMGGMGEHYELPSIKSAGISLMRIMRPLMAFGLLAAAMSYFCADYVIPAANKQFARRMYDIREKKPTLSLETGTFNRDFDRFSIRIGEKGEDGRQIGNVLIYDMSQGSSGDVNQTSAERGEMYYSDDKNYFVMHLQDGAQYNEQGLRRSQPNRGFPFVRTEFQSYLKSFDMSAWKMRVTDADAFGHHRSMRTSWQLAEGADSILAEVALQKQQPSNYVAEHLNLLEKDTTIYFPSRVRNENERPAIDAPIGAVDSVAEANRMRMRRERGIGVSGSVDTSGLAKTRATISRPTRPAVSRPTRDHRLLQEAKEWEGIANLISTFDPAGQQRVRNRAEAGVRGITNQAESKLRIVPGYREEAAKWHYEKSMKYSLAVACLIFVFIGAPMGAIVRKGGFGYPILVSIIFFVTFIILTIFCRKLAESFVLTGTASGWVPSIVLAPISLFLTYKARNDSKLSTSFNLLQFWFSIKRFFSRDNGKIKQGPQNSD